MKKTAISLILLIILNTSCNMKEGSQGKAFTEKVNKTEKVIDNDSDLLTFFDNKRTPIAPKFTALPTGSNRPKGWLLEMMQQDLQHGIVGALDELYPGIKADDLYYKARRGGMKDIPEMGDLVLTGEEWETSIMWWNAETIGNWRDGFVRHAFLTKDATAMAQSKAMVNHYLASQDADGYIGIYKENLRYQHEGSNGELWAQTTAFRMLLAYYEMTQEEKVLKAVEKAMALTMKEYNKNGRNPFDLKNAFGGVTHGLMITDVCETLYRITRKPIYQAYAAYLYQAYSTYNINRAFNDIRYPFLQKKEEGFTAHGVHTYEHLRTLINAYYVTGYEELKTVYENAMHKLERCILPSGAGHAMEWIAGLNAEPTQTAAEYCSMLELRNFYGTAAQKTGAITFGDQAEKLTFNAMLGARNDDGTAISYGKPDNCYKLDGQSLDGEEKEVRYKYSPTHSEPAVCCVPNYTRNLTYYLDQMWGAKEGGLAALLYGPSKLSTIINGNKISIEQITNYPYTEKIDFKIEVEKPTTFTFYFRKPAWSKGIKFKGEKVVLVDGFYQIKKIWKTGDVIRIEFDNEVQVKRFTNGEVYFQKGPLVYALAIPHKRENIKTYEVDGFHDYYCLPENRDFENIQLDEGKLNFKFVGGDKLILQGHAMNTKTNKRTNIELVPMGKTVLRKVTFKTL